MEWFLLLLCITIIIFVMLKNKDFMHPIVIYEFIWLINIFLYCIRLRPYYDLSTNAAMLLLISIIVFPLGFFINISFKNNHNSTEKKVDLNTWVFVVLCICSSIYLMSSVSIIIQYLQQGYSFYAIAAMGIRTAEPTGFAVIIEIVFLAPIKYYVSPICAIEFASGNPKKYYYLLINIIVIALAILDHGGRIHLLNFAISYICAFRAYSYKIILSKSIKRVLFSVIVIFVGLIVIISASRGIDDLWMSLYYYFSCSIPHMIARLEESEFVSDFTVGYFSLRGFIVPISIVLQGVGFGKSSIYIHANRLFSLTEQNTIVGYGVATNAFLPMVFFNYIDFGYIGALVGTLVFGLIMNNSYNKVKTNNNKKEIAIYIMLMMGIVTSFIRCAFSGYGFAMALIYIYLFYHKGYKRIVSVKNSS